MSDIASFVKRSEITSFPIKIGGEQQACLVVQKIALSQFCYGQQYVGNMANIFLKSCSMYFSPMTGCE